MQHCSKRRYGLQVSFANPTPPARSQQIAGTNGGCGLGWPELKRGEAKCGGNSTLIANTSCMTNLPRWALRLEETLALGKYLVRQSKPYREPETRTSEMQCKMFHRLWDGLDGFRPWESGPCDPVSFGPARCLAVTSLALPADPSWSNRIGRSRNPFPSPPSVNTVLDE